MTMNNEGCCHISAALIHRSEELNLRCGKKRQEWNCSFCWGGMMQEEQKGKDNVRKPCRTWPAISAKVGEEEGGGKGGEKQKKGQQVPQGQNYHHARENLAFFSFTFCCCLGQDSKPFISCFSPKITSVSRTRSVFIFSSVWKFFRTIKTI